MPARDQQHQVGKRDPVGQSRRQRVARQMVHPDQWQPGRRAEPFGAHHARHHATNQAGSGGNGNCVHFAQC